MVVSHHSLQLSCPKRNCSFVLAYILLGRATELWCCGRRSVGWKAPSCTYSSLSLSETRRGAVTGHLWYGSLILVHRTCIPHTTTESYIHFTIRLAYSGSRIWSDYFMHPGRLQHENVCVFWASLFYFYRRSYLRRIAVYCNDLEGRFRY